jgi:hypothetical protein
MLWRRPGLFGKIHKEMVLEVLEVLEVPGSRYLRECIHVE